MDSNKKSNSDPRVESKLSKLLRLIGWLCFVLGLVCAILLAIVYLFIGDSTLPGEAITIFPPLLWALPLTLIFLPVIFTRSWRAGLVVVICIFTFLEITEDWRSLLRTPETTTADVRVVTWNIAGRAEWPEILKQLKPIKPDIVFLQETPDGANSLSTTTLTGYWAGFNWMDAGDSAILSRYALTPLPTERVGPWDKPAIARVTIPDKTSSHTVILCGVRLMLSPFANSPDRFFTNWQGKREAHQSRLNQYINLSAMLTKYQLQNPAADVILAGDFNTRGNSRSLDPLKKAGLRDAWPESGAGWGATILADFPVARIDQIWITDDLLPVTSHTAPGGKSDHKIMFSALRIR